MDAIRKLINALVVTINNESSPIGRANSNVVIEDAEDALAGILTPSEIAHLDGIFETLVAAPANKRRIPDQPDPEDLSLAPEPTPHGLRRPYGVINTGRELPEETFGGQPANEETSAQ